MGRDPISLHDAHWRQASSAIEDPNNPVKHKLIIETLRKYELREPKILDYGCGDARMTERLIEDGFHVTGLDISPSVIERNAKRFPDVNWVLIRPGELTPFPRGSFDVVLCSEVIEHVYDANFLLAELQRIIRSRGLLLLTTPYHARIKDVVVSLFFFERHFDPHGEHIRFWTRKSLTLTLNEHGFSPIRWTYMGRFWPFWKSFFVVAQRA